MTRKPPDADAPQMAAANSTASPSQMAVLVVASSVVLHFPPNQSRLARLKPPYPAFAASTKATTIGVAGEGGKKDAMPFKELMA